VNEDEKKLIEAREKRQIKLIKEYNKKKVRAILMLIVCLCFLILNNIVTYKNVNSLAFENKSLKNNIQQVSVNNSNTKPSIKEPQVNEQIKNDENKSQRMIAGKEMLSLNKNLSKLLKEKEELKKLNNELNEDNISLQNSLKVAAAVGIKPRNYENPPQISSRSGIRKEQYLGKFKGTAYTPSKEECGNNKGITASGKPIIPGTTIAVDTKYWSIGTIFYIKGIGYVTAMDTGGGVKGKNRFDFAVFDKKFANALGTKQWDVYLVKRGNGTVDINFNKGK
jgi:3D (Asp-Asp-Asp) domain-containing protein